MSGTLVNHSAHEQQSSFHSDGFEWPDRIKLIITGTARAGTTFMSRFLTSAGIECGHEAVCGFWPEKLSGSPNAIAESSWCAAPYLRSVDATVVHIVRNPFRVIPSMMAWRELDTPSSPYTQFALSHVPEAENYIGLDRYLCFWLGWMRFIEAVPVVTTWSIEQLSRDTHSLASFANWIRGHLGVKLITTGAELYADKKCNTSNCEEMIYSDIRGSKFRDDFIQKAELLGYEGLWG